MLDDIRLALEQAADRAPVLLLAAHPDDEVIGCGAHLARWKALTIAHATDGAPLNMLDATRHCFATTDAYAHARRDELEASLATLGVTHATRIEFGLADQEAAVQIPLLAGLVSDLIDRFAPYVVFTHPYEGGHPDHDACSVAVQLATAAMGRPPLVCEFTSYHSGVDGIRTGEFLQADIAVYTHVLTAEERHRKQQALDRFTTQRQTLAPFFSCFAERLRIAPKYDFQQAPHTGQLYYERFDWGMDGARFRRLVAAAHQVSNAA